MGLEIGIESKKIYQGYYEHYYGYNIVKVMYTNVYTSEDACRKNLIRETMTHTRVSMMHIVEYDLDSDKAPIIIPF